jgi:hypothetical protein
MNCTEVPGGEPVKNALEAQGFVCEVTATGWRCIKTSIGQDGSRDTTCFDVLS